ncbi:MAG: hypothetical protein M1836_001914 [Candelina mexicana]|nr:MAG: hypothetical protein M1836_001914 [Candelina mexicana]
MSLKQGHSIWAPWNHVIGDQAHPRNDRWNAIDRDPKQRYCHCHPEDSKCTAAARDTLRRFDWDTENWQLPFKFDLCPDFKHRYALVALIGGGSFGVVYAARALQGDLTRRYAVKFEARPYAVRNERVFHDLHPQNRRFADTIVHSMMISSGAVAPLVGVYIHGALICMVMELFGGVSVDLRGLTQDLSEFTLDEIMMEPLPNLRTCTGDKFGHTSSRPRVQLKQIEACRIFWHLLGGFAGMVAAGISHNDFASRNYLVDYEFRAKIIDFGLAMLHPREDDFNINRPQTQQSPWTYHTNRYLCWTGNMNAHPPEYVNSELAPKDRMDNPIWDIRRNDLWGYGTCLYEVLHGAMPWKHTNLENYDDEDFIMVSKMPPALHKSEPIEMQKKKTKMWKKARRHLGLRNDKLVNEPLPVREDLDQDLVDVLHALFIKDPLLRCNVRDLVTFPWFQGWQEDADYIFYNHMTAFGEPSPEFSPGAIEAQRRRLSAAEKAGDSYNYDTSEDEEAMYHYQEVFEDSDDDPLMEKLRPPQGGGKE